MTRAVLLSILVVVTQLAVGVKAHAQQPGKIFRIGYLDPSTAAGNAVRLEAFRQELNKFGWIEGKNLTIEYRYAEGKRDRLPELAAELVRLKVDLIVTVGGPTPLAVKEATSTIPIVMMGSVDPVAAGVIASLARPGGNVTGLASLTPELSSKRLEVLKDAIPRLSRVGALRPTVSSLGDLPYKELRAAALALKLKLEEIETQLDAKGLESAFKTAKQKQVGWNGIQTKLFVEFGALACLEVKMIGKPYAGELPLRDYNALRCPLFRRKKTNRRACRQVPVAGHLPTGAVCR